MEMSWDDPEWRALTSPQRRSIRLAAAREKGTHTKLEWRLLHSIFGACVSCGVPYDELYGGHATKDHIKSIMGGGCDCIANLQPVCRECNSQGIGVDLRCEALPGWQTLYLHRMGAFF
jgi:5-methylcytosine-specific restriction endonuclease McrA